jgi:D-arabinose 5-phosphate isomerase GutQ
MRNLFILAAAASLVLGCHARTEDEVGAAPDRGDTTTVTASDTVQVAPSDTTMGQFPADTGFVQEDTTYADPGMGVDTVGMQGEVEAGDTTGVWTDTTETQPADTAAQQY